MFMLVSLPPDNHQAGDAETRAVDLDQVPTYSRLQFCCSKNTSRVYLYDEVCTRFLLRKVTRRVSIQNSGDVLPNDRRKVLKYLQHTNSRIFFFGKGGG